VQPIRTERLLIREYRAGDAPAYQRLCDECFLNPVSDASAADFIAWSVLNYRHLEAIGQPPYGDYLVALADTGEPVGSVGIVPSLVPWGVLPAFRAPAAPPDALVSPEFGLFYAVFPDRQRQGFAAEGAAAIIDFLFVRLYVRQVVATTEHDNIASQQVMRRLGMTLHANPGRNPVWFQVVGVLTNPGR
jgi:RimJ/RimL family protein N-acetyltransferase